MGGPKFSEVKTVDIKMPKVVLPEVVDKIEFVPEMKLDELPTNVFLKSAPETIAVDFDSMPTVLYQPNLSSNAGVRFGSSSTPIPSGVDGAAAAGESLLNVVDLGRALPEGGKAELGGATFYHMPFPFYDVYFVELQAGETVQLKSEGSLQYTPLEVKGNKQTELFPVQKGDTLITSRGIVQVFISEKDAVPMERDDVPTSEFIIELDEIFEVEELLEEDPGLNLLATMSGEMRQPGRPYWANHFENMGGISAHTRKGYSGAATPHQQLSRSADSRHLVTVRPDGSTVMVTMTGGGKRKGWQIPAKNFSKQVDRALYEDLTLEDALETSYHHFMTILPESKRPAYGEAPGVKAIGVEVAKTGNGKYEAHFASLGKGEAVVVRATGKRRKPFEVVHKFEGSNHAPEVDRSSVEVKEGDFVIAGLQNVRADEVPGLISKSNATTADQVREALMKEEQIRMYLRQGVDESYRDLRESGKDHKFPMGRMLTKSLYRMAYRVVTGTEIAKDVPWPFEEMNLLPNGDVIDPARGNKIVGHFENGDVSLVVQKVGETVSYDADAYPTSIFRAAPAPDVTPSPMFQLAAVAGAMPGFFPLGFIMGMAMMGGWIY